MRSRTPSSGHRSTSGAPSPAAQLRHSGSSHGTVPTEWQPLPPYDAERYLKPSKALHEIGNSHPPAEGSPSFDRASAGAGRRKHSVSGFGKGQVVPVGATGAHQHASPASAGRRSSGARAGQPAVPAGLGMDAVPEAVQQAHVPQQLLDEVQHIMHQAPIDYGDYARLR